MSKILIDEDTLKLALEALEGSTDKTLSSRAMKALREALAEQPAQQALDKMAENARELGLDYVPAQRKPPTASRRTHETT